MKQISIRVISFDLDDTLWAVKPVIQQANQTLYHWLQSNAPRFTAQYQLADFEQLRAEVLLQQPGISHSVSAIRLAVLQRGLAQAGYPGAEAERLSRCAFEVFIEARNRVTLFQHAPQMLNELSTHYRLVALSNGNADIQRVGLEGLFEFSLNADQVGTAKPDPRMFEQMLARTGSRPEQVIHVGDHPEHDILGAQNAGLHSLWINFSRTPWSGGKPPDLESHCLSEVAAKIRGYLN